MTDLEKYIIENRKNFDLHDPRPEVWQRLEQGLPKDVNRRVSKRIHLRTWLSIAAAVVVCFGAFFFVMQPNSSIDGNDEFSGINPSYAKQIKYTQQDINSRQKQIMSLVDEHPQLAKKFAADLVALDVTYEKLRENLFADQNQEVLLQAMISNLKLQVNILEDQLELLQHLKNDIHENSNNSI